MAPAAILKITEIAIFSQRFDWSLGNLVDDAKQVSLPLWRFKNLNFQNVNTRKYIEHMYDENFPVAIFLDVSDFSSVCHRHYVACTVAPLVADRRKYQIVNTITELSTTNSVSRALQLAGAATGSKL